MSDLERLEHLLRTDRLYFAQTCLKIINQQEKLVPLIANRVQRRVEGVMQRQEAEGRPIRIIEHKARKTGMSTWTEACIVQRFTQRPNHRALVVAHDLETAKEIFSMAETMYGQLPDEIIGGLELKPKVVSSRQSQSLVLGEPSRAARQAGAIGLNSSLRVNTAKEAQGGRGFTYHSLHLSEVAFWGEEGRKKMTALLNSVPDEPGTMIVLESTANGYNIWKRLWDQHGKPESDYERIFIPWFEDPNYIQHFLSDSEKEEFRSSIGENDDYGGEEEHHLFTEEGLELEQLKWRRWAIVNRCDSDLRTFHQEYPSYADEAFLASGNTVFSSAYIAKAHKAADAWDEHGIRGTFEPESYETVKRSKQDVSLPKGALWKPKLELDDTFGKMMWSLWEHPEPAHEVEHVHENGEIEMRKVPSSQHVVFIDPASGEDTDDGKQAYLSIEVINHRTRAQCAQLQVHGDPDLVAEQGLLAARYFHNAWLAVEITGGYGWSIARKWNRDWRYPYTYFRQPADKRNAEKVSDRIGWSTDHVTKPQMIGHFTELLRTGRHGIRSGTLADELTTFIRDEKGRSGPEPGSFSDCLMAYMGAQRVAEEKPIRSDRMAKARSVFAAGAGRIGGATRR